MNEWTEHADWWLDEIREDPIYGLDVIPLLEELMSTVTGRVLDLGCGEGQVMRRHEGDVVGCDVSLDLLRLTRQPVVCAELPDLSWIRKGSFDGAYMVLVLEHLEDLTIFDAVARVVRPGGSLTIVMNHPAFTAEGAGPIMDPTDGEILWRWGSYFDPSASTMPGADSAVTFHHRPLSDVLNAAAAAGWALEEIHERGFSNAAIATRPEYVGQEQMPRLLGARWMNTQGSRVICR